MASFRKRGDRWQVQVRRVDQPPLSKSFISKVDAQRWARHMEAQLDVAMLPQDYRQLEATTLRDILERYRDEIVPTKRGAEIEAIIIKAFLRNPLANTKLSRLSRQQFTEYRDARLTSIRPATLLRELSIIQHALDTATRRGAIGAHCRAFSMRPITGANTNSDTDVGTIVISALRKANPSLA